MTCIPAPECSPTQCDCPCHGDPVCDSIINDVLDVVMTISVAFRGGAAQFDPNCVQGNAAERTDLDCSGATDIIDVVMIVNVAFRGGVVNYCDPCVCNPYPTNCP
jgi:hypothetical protein